MVQTQFEVQIRRVQSDRGTEFTHWPLKTFFIERGIILETSCVDTLQQNGHVGCKNRYILNVARALMFQVSLPVEL